MNFATSALKILFVCAYGEVRSPTASDLWKDEFSTDYVGCDEFQLDKRREKLQWCDIIIVMSNDIEISLKEEFPNLRKPMYNVGIEDVYGRKNHPDLITELQEKVEPILDNFRWIPKELKQWE